MEPVRYEKDNEGIVTVTMDLEGAVNKFSQTFTASLIKAIERLEAEQNDIKGAILTSGKETFLAGADLSELVRLKMGDEATFFTILEKTKAMFRRLERLKKPVVAAINGTALGGGLELALACHARIALNAQQVKLGFPEVKLGLLPAGGGCVRMTWMLGAEAALPVLLEGKEYKPADALMMKIIDDVADTREDMMNKARAFIREHSQVAQPWDRSDYKIPGGRTQGQLLYMASMMLFKRTKGAMPAPEKIIATVSQALQIDFDAALRVESRNFIALATGPVAKNMINTLFFQLREVGAGASRPKDIAKNKIGKLGVLGAGMMGRGIALVSAQSGIEVVLKDVTLEAAQKGKAYCENVLETNKSKDAILARITPTGEVADLKDCDLIIEAVFENIDLKKRVTKEAEPYLNDTGFFASNTSTLPITMLSEASTQPSKFIGIHFFSPVEKMPLIEIIVGKETNDQTLAKAFDFSQQIRKTPIVVNDSRGFFTSRVIGTFISEAVNMLVEGVHPARIERMAREAGFPVGPLALWDEVSQRLSLEIAKANAGLDGSMPQSAQHEVADLLVNTHKRGGKAYGGGIYEYPQGGRKYIWPLIIELYYKPGYAISNDDIKGRFLYRQCVESIRCLGEGVLRSTRDANVGSIMGIGFPPATGGVIQLVNSIGLKKFLALMEDYTKRFGDGFTPPQLLKDKAQNDALFE